MVIQSMLKQSSDIESMLKKRPAESLFHWKKPYFESRDQK